MSVKVWKKTVRIQRDFICRGGLLGKVENDVSTSPYGGLGMKDIQVVNLNFLSNWMSRVLNKDQS